MSALKASRPVYLEFFGARGESILSVVRRLGLGGAAADATDAQAALDYSQYIVDNFDGTDLYEVLAAAAIAQEYGSIFSTPFDTIALVAPSPTEGLKYLNTSDGKAYIYTSGAWIAYTPHEGQWAWVIDQKRGYRSLSGAWKQQYAKKVRITEFDTYIDCFAFAAVAGAKVCIDDDFTLVDDLVIDPGVRGLVADGGEIYFENYDITGSGQTLQAGIERIFVQQGTGRLKGQFNHETAYPEWWGAVPAKSTDADPWTVSTTNLTDGVANSTWTWNAITQAMAYIDQSWQPAREIMFTGYMYGVAATITNPTAGRMPKLRGVKPNATRIYQSLHINLFTFTGTSAASEDGVFLRELTLVGLAYDGVHVAGLLRLDSWGGFRTKDMHWGRSGRGIDIQDTAGGFSENCIFEDNIFDYDCGLPVIFNTSQSQRGCQLRGHTLYSRGVGSGGRLINVAAGSYWYAGGVGSVTISDFGSGEVSDFITAEAPCWVNHGDFECELSGSGTVLRMASGSSVPFGGNFHFHKTATGAVVWGTLYQADVMEENPSFQGGTQGKFRLEDAIGYTQTLESGDNSVLRDIGGFRTLNLLLYNASTYQAAVQVVACTDGIGTQHRIVGTPVITRLYGSSGDDPTIALDTDGRVKLSNAGWDGSIRLFGTIDYQKL